MDDRVDYHDVLAVSVFDLLGLKPNWTRRISRPTNTLGNITIPALCKSPRGSVHPSLDIVQKKEKGTDNGRDRIFKACQGVRAGGPNRHGCWFSPSNLNKKLAGKGPTRVYTGVTAMCTLSDKVWFWCESRWLARLPAWCILLTGSIINTWRHHFSLQTKNYKIELYNLKNFWNIVYSI